MILTMMDQIEYPGFFNGPTEDEYEQLMYVKRQEVSLLSMEDRATEIWWVWK